MSDVTISDQKRSSTEEMVDPPDLVANAAKAVMPPGARPRQVPAAPLQQPVGASSVLDTTPEREPYTTDDAKTSLAELKLVGGYIYLDPKSGERKLLNRAVMREISGHEEDMLTNEKVDLSRRFQNILAECLERIGDGNGFWITDKSKMHGVIDDLTIGDRTQMLLHLRVISVYPDGEKYTFRINCPNCKKEIRHMEDLTKCKHTPMSDPMKRIYDKDLPSGKRARCRIMLGRHESIVDEAQQLGQNQLSAAIMARVLEIDGKPATMGSVKDLSKKDRDFLRQTFDDVEGGVETTARVHCRSCGARFEGDIDISQRDFFFPSAK